MWRNVFIGGIQNFMNLSLQLSEKNVFLCRGVGAILSRERFAPYYLPYLTSNISAIFIGFTQDFVHIIPASKIARNCKKTLPAVLYLGFIIQSKFGYFRISSWGLTRGSKLIAVSLLRHNWSFWGNSLTMLYYCQLLGIFCVWSH